jgi:hypothetical protein
VSRKLALGSQIAVRAREAIARLHSCLNSFFKSTLPKIQQGFRQINMLKKRCNKETSGQSARDPFAYPFKVLRDMFTDTRFVPDQEFARFDLTALRGKDSAGPVDSTRRPKPARANRERVRIPVLLLALIFIAIALVIFG